MTELPLRRVFAVLLAYAGAAWLVLFVADWLRRAVALPPLFTTLVRVLVGGGVAVAVLLAWRYPHLGLTDSDS